MSQSKLLKVSKLKVSNRLPGMSQKGATTKVFLDDKSLTGVTFLKFEVKAGGMAKVTIEMLVDAEIESELPLELKTSERIEKNLEPIIVDGKVMGYNSPRYVLGQYHPKKIETIEAPSVE